MRLKIFKKIIVITIESASQYSLRCSFKKANWGTNQKSVCKGAKIEVENCNYSSGELTKDNAIKELTKR